MFSNPPAPPPPLSSAVRSFPRDLRGQVAATEVLRLEEARSVGGNGGSVWDTVLCRDTGRDFRGNMWLPRMGEEDHPPGNGRVKVESFRLGGKSSRPLSLIQLSPLPQIP